VSSSWRVSWIFVYSSVIRTVLWPAIFDASMLDPPTSCRQVMLARRKECGPRPGKSQPSATAARFRACRTPESHSGRPLPSVRTKTQLSAFALWSPELSPLVYEQLQKVQRWTFAWLAPESATLSRPGAPCRAVWLGVGRLVHPPPRASPWPPLTADHLTAPFCA